MDYRILLHSPSYEVVGDVEIGFPDDKAAIGHARAFLFDWHYEVWRGERLIATARPPAWPGDARKERPGGPVPTNRRVLVYETAPPESSR